MPSRGLSWVLCVWFRVCWVPGGWFLVAWTGYWGPCLLGGRLVPCAPWVAYVRFALPAPHYGVYVPFGLAWGTDQDQLAGLVAP